MLGLNENLEFAGFLPEDFDAFAREKWNSNMFTLPRRRVKAKLSHIGALVAGQLDQQSLPLAMHLSDEFPSLWNKKLVDSQWLFFSRDEEAQAALVAVIDNERTLAATLADPTPRYRQVFLGAAVTETHLEVGLRLHHDAWVDRDNLLRQLERPDGVAGMLGLLRELPDFYEVGIVDDELRSPSASDEAALAAIRDKLASDHSWLFIGARLPRDQVCVVGADICASVLEIMGSLVALYRFVAWSPTNDAVSLERIAAEHEQALQRSHDQHERERAERAAELAARDREAQKLRAEIEERVREQEAWRSRELAARRAAAARAAEEERRGDARAKAEAMAAKWALPKVETVASEEPQRNDQPLSTVQESLPRPSAPIETPIEDTASGIRVGDHVRVSRGFLTGRHGVVQELDDKGGVRINFGAMSSRLALDDVCKARVHGGQRSKNENEAASPSNHAKVGLQKQGATDAGQGPRDGQKPFPPRPRGAGFSEG